MYAHSAHIYSFKCFGKAVFNLQYPDRMLAGDTPLLDNVNVILGDNGGGKSSVLRAIAIAMLAPALMESGFVPFRLVRRPGENSSLLKVIARLDSDELEHVRNPQEDRLELLARIDRSRNERNERDRLHLESTPTSPLEQLIYDDYSHAFFVVGYGATRRVETGDFSPSSNRKMRGLRYQRVASLFEDHVALQPVESALESMGKNRAIEALNILGKVVPSNIQVSSQIDANTGLPEIRFRGEASPFAALSDGYRAFIGMALDLLSHIAAVCPDNMSLDRMPGIVLIDEVDLHLHPSWQRTVLGDLAKTFPRMQFIVTSHSPLVVNSVEHHNILLTEDDDEGLATIREGEEAAFGRSVDQLLMSSYFGLDTTRPESEVQKTDGILRKVAEGDRKAALQFMEQLGKQRSHKPRVR